MASSKIDFKHIRANASIKKVLAHYGIALEKDGSKEGQFRCLCPFHEDASPSMKVNTDRNIYNCFVCGEGGNVIDFAMYIDGLDKSHIRTAAANVASICGIATTPSQAASCKTKKAKPSESDTPVQTEKRKIKKQKGKKKRSNSDNTDDDGKAFNKPLTFTLKNLVTEHQFITRRELTPEMVEQFGVGIAQRGMMQNRLVFPIHNVKNELVAYCGRWVEKDKPAEEPKYKQPPNFRKDLELFGLQQALEIVEATQLKKREVFIVESFLSAIKMNSWGFPTVSPMGRSVSDIQLQILIDIDLDSVVLLFDGDDPGRHAVATESRKLQGVHIKCTAPCVSEDFKPHRLSGEELAALLQA